MIKNYRYYRGTHGVIVVYDVTNGESFANVKRWLQEIEHNCDVVNKILVGNKNDAPESKVVVTDDAQRFAKQMDIELFETSAKDNINVEEMFLAITQKVLEHKLASISPKLEPQCTIHLKRNPNNKKRSKCC